MPAFEPRSGFPSLVRTADHSWPMFGAIVAAFLLISRQAFYGFVYHDDWDFLLPPGAPVRDYTSPWSLTLAEGRWINWLWYFVSQHLNSIATSIIFIALFATICWRASAMLRDAGRGSLLLAVVLFFSPFVADLSLWPTTLLPAASILLTGVLLLTTRATSDADLLVLVVAFYGCVLSYPPLGEVLVLLFALKHQREGWKFLGTAAACVLASYAAGVLTMSVLNWLMHGYFGVRIAPWRNPHPLHSLADLHTNALTYWKLWSATWFQMPAALVASGSAAVVALTRPATRRTAMIVLLTTSFLVCIDMGISLITGVEIPVYSVAWLWFAMCVFPVLLMSRECRYVGFFGVAVLLINLWVGFPTWWLTYSRGADTMANISLLTHDILQRVSAKATLHRPVLIAGDPGADPRFAALFPEGIDLGMILWLDFGIRSQHCAGDACRRIEQAPHRGVVATTSDGQVVLRFPPRGA